MKSIAIVFPDEHLPYSPTLLNLSESLSAHFETHVLGFANRQYKERNLPRVRYLPIPFAQKKVYGLINKFSRPAGRRVLAAIKKNQVRRHLAGRHYDIVIVTDLIGLWMVKGLPISQLHLLSLELTWNTFHFQDKVNVNDVRSIIIQSEDRLQHLAPGYKGQVFYIQNAPSFHASQQKTLLPEPNKLLFVGTAFEKFGFLACLEFIQTYPGYQLTLQGKLPAAEEVIVHSKYEQLISEGRLIIETDYLDEPELLRKIAGFRISFCLYDFGFSEINNVNYLTAPSGKMFMSFAAGVPVVGISIPGLKPIAAYDAGSLVEKLDPISFKNAIDQIEENYAEKVAGCYRAAQHFSFRERVVPFIQFLQVPANR